MFNWNILFSFSYILQFIDFLYGWMHKLLVCHILDVMHIEKNVCKSIFGTLLDIKNKSKNGKNYQDDLQQLGIRKSLWPQQKGKKIFLPPAPHTLSKK